MVKGLISFIKESISKINDLRYFGDVVVYSSDDFLGEGIEWFTKSEFTHCALRTGKNKAEGVRINWFNLIPFRENGDIRRYHNLENPLEEYKRYIILRHKNISLFKRIKMKNIYEKMEFKKYDLSLFLRKAFNYKILRKDPDLRNLSREEYWLCGFQTGYCINETDLPITDEINLSQIEPHHFLKSKYFERTYEWNRNGKPKEE